MTKYSPDLRPDAYGPPDALRGYTALTSWLRRDPLALALRHLTTDADVRAAIHVRPGILELLRSRPGPYAQHVAEHDAALAMREIESMLASASSHGCWDTSKNA